MKGPPRTTVVIPAFNAEATLQAAVESALGQTVGELEVLVVDDGSRTPAVEVLEHVHDSRLRIVRHQVNRGLSAARNTAVSLVTTPYLSQLDADDLWERGYLEAVLPLLEDPAVGLAYTDAVIFHADGTVEPYLKSHLDHPVDTFPDLARENPIAALTATMRTQAVRSVGGYSIRLWGGQDWHLYLKLAAAGWRFAYVDRPLARYRWPEDHGGMSSDLRKVLATDVQLLADFKLHHPGVRGPGRQALRRALSLARSHTPVLSPAARRVRSALVARRQGQLREQPGFEPELGRPLRVVTLVGYLSRFGGAEHIALQLTRGLDPARFQRTFVVSRWSEALRAEEHAEETLQSLLADGVSFLGLERASTLHLRAWWPLLRLLRRERADVLHSHMFGSNVWAVVLGRIAGVPVVVCHEHTWSFEGQPLRKLLDRWLIARFSDALIAVSQQDRRRMIELEGIADRDIVVVPNGVPDDPPATRGDVRAELGIGSQQPVVGTVSTLRPQKRTDLLIRAALSLSERFPDLRVLVAGRGPEQPRLERLTDQLGLDGTVLFVGQRPDVPDFLEALDVAVCSSEYEGSPLSVMEYMRAGLPTVATRVSGLPELIEDGVSGHLVEPDDPDAIAEAVGRLLSDPGARRLMGERARERQQTEFTMTVLIRRIEALYARLRGAHRPRA